MPYYLNENIQGLMIAASLGDGYSINLKWPTAYPSIRTNKIGYNIYMSSDIAPDFPNEFFWNAPTFIKFDGYTNVDIVDLIPGQMYHFGVRAFEYNSTLVNLSLLPEAYNGLFVLPMSLLAADVGLTDVVIDLMDVSGWPVGGGTFKLGEEYLKYGSVDAVGNRLLEVVRGFEGGLITEHLVDGYDGYSLFNPNAIYWPVEVEEENTVVFECFNRFDIEHYSFTIVDGYRQNAVDILNTNLTYSDVVNADTPPYDFAGYHRTDPTMILDGSCVGSYIGGYYGCSDGYSGVGMQLRGLNIQDANIARQEVLLSTTGEPCVLVQKKWTGIRCSCFLPNNEYPEARCNKCFGTGYVVGWNQFFDVRRSDGRIMVRFDPTADSVASTESGLESTMNPNCWTLPSPSLHSRDFIVRFDEDGNQEFRYEILNVTRNKLLLDQTGAQKFAAQRIRKTDVIYQVPIFYDTSLFPTQISTSLESSLGIPLHQHGIQVSEKIVSINQINEVTAMSAGHSHSVIGGVVQTVLGHSHSIIL